MWLTIILVILLAPALLLAGALLLNRVPLTEPPGFMERLRTYLGQNTAILAPESRFPELRPVIHPVKPELLCRQIPPALDELGWEWQTIPGDCRYHAVVSTPLLGFMDDLMIGVEAIGDSSSHLVVVSGSRIGKGDLGANTRHILDLVQAIERQQ